MEGDPSVRGEMLVFYDGLCGFCRNRVTWARKHMRPGTMRMVPVESDEGQRILVPLGLQDEANDTFVALADGKPLLRSDAAVAVAARLRWPRRALSGLRIVPRPLRDWGYNQIAKRRRRDAACSLDHKPLS